jgi:cyclophilin family peptidyl-prolyl cis-trans isomerase
MLQKSMQIKKCFTAFGTPKTVARLNKVWLDKTYNKVHMDKKCDTFAIQNGLK